MMHQKTSCLNVEALCTKHRLFVFLSFLHRSSFDARCLTEDGFFCLTFNHGRHVQSFAHQSILDSSKHSLHDWANPNVCAVYSQLEIN